MLTHTKTLPNPRQLLIDAIDEFLSETGMGPTVLCKKAGVRLHAIHDLRIGLGTKISTLEALVDAINAERERRSEAAYRPE